MMVMKPKLNNGFFKLFYRNLIRKPLISLIKIVGLTIGIAAFIFIIFWIKHEYSFDNFHPKIDRIYALGMSKDSPSGISYPIAPNMANQFPEIETYTRYENFSQFETCMLKYSSNDQGKEPVMFYETNFHLVDTSFFKLFGYHFIYGDADNSFNNLNSIVLREEVATKYFGNKNPLGETLIFNNKNAFTVTGVVRIPSNSHLQFNVLAPIETIRGKEELKTWQRNGNAYVLLKKGVDKQGFSLKISNFITQLNPQLKSEDNYLSIHRFNQLNVRNQKTRLQIFGAIGLIILLIVSINYMNITVALVKERKSEIGIRKTNGASKKELIIQLLLETAMSLLISISLAFIVVGVLHYFLKDVMLINMNVVYKDIYFVVSVFVLLFLLLTVITGLYPALSASSTKVTSLLKPKSNPNKLLSGRKVLVITQFIATIVLIISSIVIYKQVSYLNRRSLGFNKDYILQIPISPELNNRFDAYKQLLLKNPSIVNVTAGSSIPSHVNLNNVVSWGSMDEDQTESMSFLTAKCDFIETFDMEIIKGRSFSKDNQADKFKFIVNETAFKLMEMDDVGESLSFQGMTGELIGVVNDFENNNIEYKLRPLIFWVKDVLLKYVFVKISKNDILGSVKYIEDISKQIVPESPFEYRFLDSNYQQYYEEEMRNTKLIIGFSILGIILACTGLYGLALFSYQKRIKEIGVRKANGAKTNQLMTMLNLDFIKWIVLAFITACPIAYYIMNKWLENFAYKTSLSWWVFGLAGFIVLFIAIATVSWQSWRAANRNPVEALRYE